MEPLRILFVTPYVPSLLRTRPYGFIKALGARGHRISLLSAATSAEEMSGVADVRPFCEDVEVVRVPLARSLWNCARGIAGAVPFQALFAHSPALVAALEQKVVGGRFDVVHVEHLRAALLGLAVRGTPRVFDAVDCISALFERAARDAASARSRWRSRLDLGRTRRFESRLLRQFDASLVSSDSDRAALLAPTAATKPAEPRAAAAEDTPAVIPNGVDLDYFSPDGSERADGEIVFTGRMSYHANVAATARLIHDIM